LKLWKGKVLLVLLVIVSLISSGCEKAETTSMAPLTLEAVVQTFEKEGVPLEEDTSTSPEEFRLNAVEPAIFRMGGTQERLLIYIFDSPDDIEEFFYDFFGWEQFTALNALIQYIPAENPESRDNYRNFFKTSKTISTIVFDKLNDGKRVVYKGEGENWEAAVKLQYYHHWMIDKRGTNHYSNCHMQSYDLHYKNLDIKKVGEVSVKFEGNGHSSECTGGTLDHNGHLNAGGGGSNGYLGVEPREEIYHVTVKWNGKEEKFDLRAQPWVNRFITVR